MELVEQRAEFPVFSPAEEGQGGDAPQGVGSVKAQG